MAKLLKETMSVDTVLNVAKACASLVTGVANADTNKDGKYSVGEISIALLQNIGGISTIATQSKEAYNSFKLLKISERRLVISAFAEAFDLPDDDAETKIESVLEEANEITSAVVRLVNKFKKRQETGEVA